MMYAFWKILFITLGVLSIHLSVVYFKVKGDMDRVKIKLVIDTDAGGDDAMALLLALRAESDYQTVAVTCVYGNTNLENVEKNVLKILTVADRTDIPVYSGASKPLIQNYSPGNHFGSDGLGDFEFDKKITASIDRSMHASQAMIELSKQHSGNINILTLGPLTNVALAASLDSNFTRRVNRFYVMGSTKFPKTEYNFGLDPESNAVFLNSTVDKKTLVTPWNVVEGNKISNEWRTKILGDSSSEAMKFLNRVERAHLKDNSTQWLSSDSVAVATMLWPDLVTSSSEVLASAVLEGDLRGSVILDGSADRTNAEIVEDFDVNGFKKKLIQYLT